MYVNIGELRHRVTVLRPRAEPDASGNLVAGDCDEVFSCWAKVLPFAAKISDGTAELVREVDYRVVLRYRPPSAIRTEDIILWQGRKLSPVAPPYPLDGKRRWLVIECRELVEDA